MVLHVQLQFTFGIMSKTVGVEQTAIRFWFFVEHEALFQAFCLEFSNFKFISIDADEKLSLV